MFSKKIFNKHYGQIFIISNLITFIGFLLFIYVVFFAKEPMNVGDVLGFILGGFCILGFLGFPTSLVAYSKTKQKLERNKLEIENNKIYYMKIIVDTNSIIKTNEIEEYYDILRVDKFKIANRYIILYGDIIKEIKKNGKTTKTIDKCIKIERAFNTDQLIINYLKSNDIKDEKISVNQNEIKFSKDLTIRLLKDSVIKKIGCICEFMYNHRKHSIGVAYYNENEIIYFLDNQEFNDIDKFLTEAAINDTKLEELNDDFIIKSFNNYSYKELEEIKEKQTLI